MEFFKPVSVPKNLCKSRKWPSHKVTGYNPTSCDPDLYFTYDLHRKDIGKYLNTWFLANNVITQNGIRIEFATLKRVDEDTSKFLYHRIINPVSIWISPSYMNQGMYDMKAQLHSIDDSSYGTWWVNRNLEDLKLSMSKLMNWVTDKLVLNGEDLLDECEILGSDKDQRDYN